MGDTDVRTELEVVCATLDVLVVGVVEVTVDNLFGEGEGTLEPWGAVSSGCSA